MRDVKQLTKTEDVSFDLPPTMVHSIMRPAEPHFSVDFLNLEFHYLNCDGGNNIIHETLKRDFNKI